MKQLIKDFKTKTLNGTEVTLSIDDKYQIEAEFMNNGEKIKLFIDGWNALQNKKNNEPDGIYGYGFVGGKRLRIGLSIPKEDWNFIYQKALDKQNEDRERALALDTAGFIYKMGCDTESVWKFEYEENDLPFNALYSRMQQDEKLIELIKKIDIDEIAKKYNAESIPGDMSIYYGWHFTGKAFDALMKKANELLIENQAQKNRQREKEKRIAEMREAARKELSVEIIEASHRSGGECGPDPYAKVRVTDPSTSESATFTCRNIFDFGYVINTEDGGKTMTDFEVRVYNYLLKFPPIDPNIRI